MPRRFDKKKGVKFVLVSRTAHDPETGEKGATAHVLQPVMDPSKATARQARLIASLPEDVFESAPDPAAAMRKATGYDDVDGADFFDDGDLEELEQEEEEEEEEEDELKPPPSRSAGPSSRQSSARGAPNLQGVSKVVHDYDYTKHLRSIGDPGGLFVRAPSADGATTVADVRATSHELTGEEKFFTESELQAAHEAEKMAIVPIVRVKATHDFVHALEGEDLDAELAEGIIEELEDDFVAMAMADTLPEQEVPEDDEEDEEDEDEEEDEEEDDDDEEEEDDDDEFEEDDEEKEDGPRRPWTDLDEHFSRLVQQYDDDEIGELAAEDPRVAGPDELAAHSDIFREHLSRKDERRYAPNVEELGELKDKVVRGTADLEARELSKPMDVVDRELEEMYKPAERPEFDCESVLSTLSTTSNLPRIIAEPRRGAAPQIALSQRTGAPVGMMPVRSRKGATTTASAAAVKEGRNEDDDEGDEEEEEEEEEEGANLGERRNKLESKEEKRARKQAAKELKRQRRTQKKAVQQMYAAESTAQSRVAVRMLQSAHGAVRL